MVNMNRHQNRNRCPVVVVLPLQEEQGPLAVTVVCALRLMTNERQAPLFF